VTLEKLVPRYEAFLSAAISRFGLVSLIGWGGDFFLFVVLVNFGVDPLIANGISAGAATTFVYFQSVYRVFRYSGKFLYRKFVGYVVYQVAAIALAAAAISVLVVSFALQPWLAKILITPLTFFANYFFMKFLTGHGRSEPKAEEQ